ncbi:MAG: hypothetical protein K0R10_1693 [Alphaproteobacteria bacterium]|jgi:hypothetical protein|nr:hypothetical protein [Alphaproteobacteria bacterium]
MKFALAFIAAVIFSAPAIADRGDDANAPKIVIAKTTSEQRAVAESISGRLRSALDSEPYTIDADGRDTSTRR